ncbi:MAG: PAS domain S-box protein, partial [Myxococcales bacterium]
LDPSGRIETWGTGARQVFGHDEEAIVGQPIDVLFTAEDRAANVVANELAEARARGQATEERWHLRRGGERFWASGVMAALRDDDGTLRGYAKVCRDLTEQKHTDERREAQLTRETSARAAAEQATEAKDAFLATVSHELRTPLSSMLLWAKMLEEGQGSERERAAGLAAIVRGGEAQRQIIEDLLDLSRMVSGTLRIEPADVDLGATVRSAVDTVQAMARARSLRLEAHLEASERVVVRGDAARLQQVLWNLLTNALKFTPRGGRVELRLETTARVARVVVRDTGRGIDRSFLPHVFDRLRQGEGDATRPAAGLGLGLSIVRELVALHGGRVEAASEGPGCGATFTVELPRLGRPSSPPPPSSSARVGEVPPERPLAGMHVLLVEDNLETQQALVWLLEASGAEVSAAASAPAALAALTARWPDLLVSDIGLPGENGYELMGRVRTHAAAQGRPPPPALGGGV